MIRSGILNLQLATLLRRVRHTNTLVIADRGFPSWSGLETIDLSLVADVPTVLQVLEAIKSEFVFGAAWIAQEFLAYNSGVTQEKFATAFSGVRLLHEPHVEFKKRVSHAVGVNRTGDTTQYANMILESA